MREVAAAGVRPPAATFRRPPRVVRVAGVLGVLLALLPGPAAVAQVPVPRPGEPPPFQREEPRREPPRPVLPPLPPPAPGQPELLPVLRVLVREIRVVGSTVFSAEEIGRVTAPFTGRQLSAEDLEALRTRLTLLYVERGYVNSGAMLPDQDLAGGVVTYQIVEGQVTGIEVQGTRWFRAGHLRDRLALGAGPPLNVNDLQERLQLLLEDERLRRLNAELRPGTRPGQGFLDVRVEERRPYRLVLDFNNHQPPSVGAERGLVTLEHLNLTGNADVLALRYGRSDGLDPLLDFRYAVPLTPWDTTLSLQYRRDSFTVVEEPFDALEIESDSEIYTVAIRQPVYRTLGTEVALELIGERLSSETSLLGTRFSLSPGARRGESVVTAIRIAQDVVHRTRNQVIAARSRFSVGIDALGATAHGGREPDGQFFAWLGQLQWVRRLGLLDSQLILRSDLQLAGDRLLTLEQVAVGGRYSVRGYRENTLVRDNAWLVSLEVRVPLLQSKPGVDFLQLAAFYDYGRGWDARTPSGTPRDISSVGVGLRWAATLPVGPLTLRPSLELYWGHPLRNVETPGGNLQDEGLHFQALLTVF